jgi:hypothetical protein
LPFEFDYPGGGATTSVPAGGAEEPGSAAATCRGKKGGATAILPERASMRVKQARDAVRRQRG